MKEINTKNTNRDEREVGGEWACLVACIGGCTAAEIVVPGGIVLSAYATVASAL